MKKIVAVLLTVFFSCSFASAQYKTPYIPYMDSVLASYLEKINHFSNASKYASEVPDTLISLNRALMAYLKHITADYKTIESHFTQAENMGLMSMISEDKLFRLYAWDTWTGNTMHYFNALAQFRFGNNANIKVLNDISDTTKPNDPGSYFTELNTIHTRKGKTIYLVTGCTVASAHDKAQGISAYAIENGALKNVPFLKTKKHIADHLDFVYDVSYDSLTSIIISIHFSSDKKILYIPVVMPNGHLANEYWIYILKHDKYVFKKKIKGIKV